jgi:hypothetical protein
MESITRKGYGLRRMVASYGSYAEAQGVVDRLADEGFPVERVSIVAEGLRFEERITGRKGYGRAALERLGAGAIPGALIGLVFGLFSLVDPLVSGLLLAFYGFVFGAVLGAIIGLISYALSGGRRDFSSVGEMRADSYDVVADDEVAEEASRLLAERS